MLFLLFPTVVEPEMPWNIIIADEWTQTQSVVAADWSESLTVASGNYGQGITT